MAGKAKHGYQLRQKPKNTWEILARDQEGKEFWYGDFTMKQNAVRWGDTHKIEGRYPQVVERFDDPFGIADSSNSPAAAFDPVDRAFQKLCQTVGVNQSDIEDVKSFAGLTDNQVRQITDPASGELIWQPL